MQHHDDLARFVDAQQPVYETAVAILRGGSMCTPYMDFIFPRLAGLPGSSRKYGLQSIDEARAYLAFDPLGNRYRECVEALSWLGDRPAQQVFGDEDATKLQASLTLFAEASNEQLLRLMLFVWFEERVDEETISRLIEDGA